MWTFIVDNQKLLLLNEKTGQLLVIGTVNPVNVAFAVHELNRRHKTPELMNFEYTDAFIENLLNFASKLLYKRINKFSSNYKFEDAQSDANLIITQVLRRYIPNSRSSIISYAFVAIKRYAITSIRRIKGKRRTAGTPRTITDETISKCKHHTLSEAPRIDAAIEVDEALQNVKSLHARVLKLVYMDGNNLSETASILGVTKQRIHQVICMVKKSALAMGLLRVAPSDKPGPEKLSTTKPLTTMQKAIFILVRKSMFRKNKSCISMYKLYYKLSMYDKNIIDKEIKELIKLKLLEKIKFMNDDGTTLQALCCVRKRYKVI